MCKWLKDFLFGKSSTKEYQTLSDQVAENREIQKIPTRNYSLRSIERPDKEKRKVEAVNLYDVCSLINTINGKSKKEHTVVELLDYIGTNMQDFGNIVYLLNTNLGGIVFYFDREYYRTIKSNDKGYNLVVLDNLALALMLQKFCGLSQEVSEEYADQNFVLPRTGYDIDR